MGNMNHSVVALLLFSLALVADASTQLSKREIWTKSKLSYSVFGSVAHQAQTSEQTVRRVLRDAFAAFENSSCFRFSDVTPSSQADIKLIFTNDDSPSRSQANPFLPDFSHRKFCKSRIEGQ